VVTCKPNYLLYHNNPAVISNLASANLIVPRYRLDSNGRRCFAVAGPSIWNSLPDSLRGPALSVSIFRRHLKTHFLRNIDETYLAHQNHQIMRMRCVNLHFTYLLTYLLTYLIYIVGCSANWVSDTVHAYTPAYYTYMMAVTTLWTTVLLF